MIGATVQGLPELKRKLEAMQREVKSILKEGSLAGAAPIHDEAERIAPRSSVDRPDGHMADHIEVEVAKSTASECQVRIGPDEDHWYGRFPETGTSKMAAQPFLRPAIDTKEGEALEKFSEVVRRRLK